MPTVSRSAARRLFSAALLLVLAASCSRGEPLARPSSDLVAIGAGLSGPRGVKATAYARGPVNVAAAAFDDTGRLWLASAAFNDTGEDAVYVVPRSGADAIPVITQVHTPLGLLWHDGALYVASKERIDAYSSFDGSHFASTTNVVTFPAGVGEVNGITIGPDGRLLVGISAPCDHCVPESRLSAAVVSLLPTGGDMRVYASAIRAPIGLVYYPGTSDLFVTINHRDDLGDATPGDWLAVVREGESWGFPDCYGQGGRACAGVPTPVAELDKHAAVSGVAIVTGQLKAVGTAAIVAEWSSGKVQRVALTKTSDGYAGRVEPFLTGLANPVAVALFPDGAVLVGDWKTGAVYRVESA